MAAILSLVLLCICILMLIAHFWDIKNTHNS
jgi:hypothetical protein